MSLFSTLSPRPADALLGLMAAFRADPRADKVDLGVGVYREDGGTTPVMRAVKAAEHQLVETQSTKVYEGPRGNVTFCTQIEELIFGDAPTQPVISYAAPGGCGALALGLALAGRNTADATVWVSNPTWPNHVHIARTAGLQTASYRYVSSEGGTDIGGMIEDLSRAQRGDVVILQGPCHNPTGIDLSKDEWAQLAPIFVERGLIPFIDIAYHGFARSLTEDMAGVRHFLANVPDAMVSYSCSKNFGLYRERTGAIIVQSPEQSAVDAIGTHLADLARASYSMPPGHGPGIVATILTTPALRTEWEAEVSEMRTRIQTLRAALAEALHPSSNSYDPAILTQQNGMFSQLPFVDGATDALREAGLYIPGSGRINIAGLAAPQIETIAKSMSPYL